MKKKTLIYNGRLESRDFTIEEQLGWEIPRLKLTIDESWDKPQNVVKYLEGIISEIKETFGNHQR